MQSINEVNADIDAAIQDSPPENITPASMRGILKKITTFLNDLTYGKVSAWFSVGTGLPSLNATDDIYRTGKVIVGTNVDDGSGAKMQVAGRFSVNSGTFHKIKAANADSLLPIDYIDEPGAGQLQFAGNWISGSSDLALVNSNLASVGFSFWRMPTAKTKKLLLMIRDGIGIGIANPSEALHVVGSQMLEGVLKFPAALASRKISLYGSGTNDNQFFGLGIDSSQLRYQVDGAGSDHVFFAGTSPVMSAELVRIKGNGRVGVGTSSPRSMLDVNGEIMTSSRLTLTYNNLSTSPNYGIDNANDLFRIFRQPNLIGGAGSVFVSITNAGYMGIGVNMGTPTSQLHVKGTTGYNQLRLENSYTPTGVNDPNGAVGEVCWDANYFYLKSPGGWRRTPMTGGW